MGTTSINKEMKISPHFTLGELTKKGGVPNLTLPLVIRLGLEPKTYCLEGSCSIQLSYRTGLALFRFAGAKVYNFWQTAK